MRHYYAHWTWSSHFNSSPARLLVTRDMRLFVTRDLTFWHFDYFTMRCPETMSDTTFWHVWVWRYDFRRGCQSRLVTVKNWKTFYLLAAYDNRWKTICHWRHLYVLISWGCFCSLKKEIGLSTGEKKKLRGYSFFFKLSVKYQTKRSWLLFYFQAVTVLHLHKNYFILSLFTIRIIAIGHAW